jgi:hypothetical protein
VFGRRGGEAEDDVAAAMPKMMEVWPTGARRGGTGGRTTPARRMERFAAMAFRRNRGVDEVEGYATTPREGWQRRLMHERGGRGLPEETSTRRKERPARATAFRRNSGDAVAWPGKRTALRCRERWWRRRPALRGRGRGGRRRNRGGNTTVAGGEALPEVSAGNRGQAGVEEVAATLEEATARPAGARARR